MHITRRGGWSAQYGERVRECTVRVRGGGSAQCEEGGGQCGVRRGGGECTVRQVSGRGREGHVGDMLGVVSSQAVTQRAGRLESMRIGFGWPMR